MKKKENVPLRTGPQTCAAIRTFLPQRKTDRHAAPLHAIITCLHAAINERAPHAPSLRGLPSEARLGECPIVKQEQLQHNYVTPSTASRSPSLKEGGRRCIGTFITMALVIMLLLSCAVPVMAADGNVTYSDAVRECIFAPGSAYSPTDLFPNFKDVMPGDSITQPITVKNDASNRVKIKIYMRSLGAHEESVAFLSKLHLRVEKSEQNTMAYMFDAAANETAQLTDWVCLGTLYSGGEVDLNVILDVPAELDNTYQELIGYLDWEFMIEEYEIEPTDPEPPKTGDDSMPGLWITLMAVSLAAMLLLLFAGKRERKEKQ